jgi:hypothetical protein
LRKNVGEVVVSVGTKTRAVCKKASRGKVGRFREVLIENVFDFRGKFKKFVENLSKIPSEILQAILSRISLRNTTRIKQPENPHRKYIFRSPTQKPAQS